MTANTLLFLLCAAATAVSLWVTVARMLERRRAAKRTKPSPSDRELIARVIRARALPLRDRPTPPREPPQ